MKVLIIGSGGREHALAWKVAKSEKVSEIFVAPGNAGTCLEPKTSNVSIEAHDLDNLLSFAKGNNIDLTIVGPEAPLSGGIVDLFQEHRLACFGPNKNAARLEASKSFCKDFLIRHQIPTAKHETFHDATAALAYIENQALPIVIKADGLCAGKGVTVAYTWDEAKQTIQNLFKGKEKTTVVIEEFLQGEEASFIVMCDGENILPFATSQDHKARDEGDTGPNTGGMGAYSPAPVIDEQLFTQVLETVIKPTVAGMKKEGNPYVGFLYAGLMITPDNEIKVLEYNCRLGDPEAQVLLMRLQSDFVTLCQAALNHTLEQVNAQWDSSTALGVVLASNGYPHGYDKNKVIAGLDDLATSSAYKIFHAGTKISVDNIVTNGGRVLCAVALGDSVNAAQSNAYEFLSPIDWDGMFYRKDIGYRAIES